VHKKANYFVDNTFILKKYSLYYLYSKGFYDNDKSLLNWC